MSELVVHAFVWADEAKKTVNARFETANLPDGMEVQGTFSFHTGDKPSLSTEEVEQLVQQLTEQMPMLQMMVNMQTGVTLQFNIAVGNPDDTGNNAEEWLRRQS